MLVGNIVHNQTKIKSEYGLKVNEKWNMRKNCAIKDKEYRYRKALKRLNISTGNSVK